MICPDAKAGKCNSTDCPHHGLHFECAECRKKPGPDCPPCELYSDENVVILAYKKEAQ